MHSTDNPHTDDSWFHDGWICGEWNDDWSSVGLHDTGEVPCNNSASSFSHGIFALGAMSSPKMSDWAKMNLDTGGAVNTFPLNFGPDGAGDGRFYRTASGECIHDGGAWQFRGHDENGLSFCDRKTRWCAMCCVAREK